jgi:tetratricopeptide (TPR) repeat protein
MLFKIKLIIIFTFGVSALLFAQGASYETLMTAGDYKSALAEIQKKFSDIYGTRVDGKRLPTDFITIGAAEESVDLNKLFRQRKAEPYFIEDNPGLYKLHRDAAVCYFNTGEYNLAISHNYQSLRYKIIAVGGDDAVFYDISQVYKKEGYFRAYINSLETAYTVNPDNMEYSLELGKSLYRTNETKKAIFHLSRYLESKGENLDDFSLLIMIANLNSDIGRYLETVKYYQRYLSKKTDDGFIHFALGYLAFNHTGNYRLAESELAEALKYLPAGEILRRQKCYEYTGDINMNELRFQNAVDSYLQTIQYEKIVQDDIKAKQDAVKNSNDEIRSLKASLLKERNFVKYSEYQFQSQERDRIEYELFMKNYEYRKLNSGKVRWNIGECYEKIQNPEKAMAYYRECITYNYRSNEAREKIIKIQLKIKRGY